MRANTRKATEEAKLNTAIMLCFYTAILVNNGLFNHGQKRLQQFADEFSKTMRDYLGRYDEVTLDAMRAHCEQLGIHFEEI
jgi:hypothetical protein